jgi:dihydrofolate synthase / folylpolyglutamate synthase
MYIISSCSAAKACEQQASRQAAMYIQAFKTHKISSADKDIYAILDSYLPALKERCVVTVTSKIVSICEGRIVPVQQGNKEKLIQQEADLYLPSQESKYHITLTVKGRSLIPSAGIDESNGNGHYVLWPSNPQQSANSIRAHLRKKHKLAELGVILTDSTTSPLRCGVTGVAIAHSGFEALKSRIGHPDIYGHPLRVTKVDMADALATSAVLLMGEADEQTPLAVLTDLPFVSFQDANPSTDELDALHINIEDDLYGQLLTAVNWKKGAG